MSINNLIIATLAIATLASATPIKISEPIAITQESTLGYIRDSYEPIVEETRFQMPPYPFEAPDFHQGFKPIQPAPQFHSIPSMAYHSELPVYSEIYPSTSLQVPQKDSYDFFSSSYLQNNDDYPQKMDAEMEAMQKLQPPPLPLSGEIDYYSMKPRKYNPKKYSAGKMHVHIKKQKSGFKATSDINDKEVNSNPLNDQYFQDPIFKMNEPIEHHNAPHDEVDDQKDTAEDQLPSQEASETKIVDNQDTSKDASSSSPAIPEKKIVTSAMNKEIARVM